MTLDKVDTDGIVQDCDISSVPAMEIPQSCTKPLKYPSPCLAFSLFDVYSLLKPHG